MARKSTSKYKLGFSSPVTLIFAAICVTALILQMTTHVTNRLLFSVYRSSLRDVLTYFRFVGHIFGHSGITHLVNNMMMFLLLGPMVEERFGTTYTVMAILATALSSGLLYFIVFPGSALLGASGVVFCFIMMAATTGFKNHEIPITFILVAALYLGEQIFAAITSHDNVSQLTHIVGGVVGVVVGIIYAKNHR